MKREIRFQKTLAGVFKMQLKLGVFRFLQQSFTQRKESREPARSHRWYLRCHCGKKKDVVQGMEWWDVRCCSQKPRGINCNPSFAIERAFD